MAKPTESGDAGGNVNKPFKKDSGRADDGKHKSFTPNLGKRRAFKKLQPPRQPKFDGKCEDLKGHIYDCSTSRQVDLFAKSTKEIAEHVGRTFRYGTDIQRAIPKLSIPTIKKPSDPADETWPYGPVRSPHTSEGRQLWRRA
jgi:hypothetical protein